MFYYYSSFKLYQLDNSYRKHYFVDQRECVRRIDASRRHLGGELLRELQQLDHQVTHDDQVRSARRNRFKIHNQSEIRFTYP